VNAPAAGTTGYLHPAYAASLAEFGAPRHLPESDGWIIERRIADGPDRDAMGPYPLFACRDWSKLHRDLDAIGDDLVSLVLVTDPFGNFTRADLERSFPDRLIRFKDHFVADLGEVSLASLPKHHRYYARRALRDVEVDALTGAEAIAFASDWTRLYASLIERHGLSGIKAFSPAAFEAQLRLPGLVALRARVGEETVGAHLWFSQGEVAYSHLAAVSPRGYELMAAYALYAFALDHFRAAGTHWLDIGAGAGTSGEGDDGLTRFKKGWATGTKPVWFCGRIFDRARYAAAVAARGIGETAYFPAYRAGEFG
jgi:hypothetical protein